MNRRFGRGVILPFSGEQIVAGGPPPADSRYLWRVVDASVIVGKQGSPQLAVTREVVEGPHEHCTVSQVYPLGPEFLGALNGLYTSSGLTLTGNVHAEALIGTVHYGTLRLVNHAGRAIAVVEELASPDADE